MTVLHSSSWAHMTWPELAVAIPEAKHAAILPLGATEQHGPHLGTGMDSVLAEILCREVGERTGVPVLPALHYGSSAAHSARWPGTLALSPQTFISVVAELGDWLYRSGMRRLFLVNCHVGNAAPAASALDTLRCRYDDFSVALLNVGKLDPAIEAEFARDAADWHANAAETSLMMAVAPGCVRADLVAGADDPDRTTDAVFAYPVNRTSRNGVTGKPSEASAGAGEKLYALLAAVLVEKITRGLSERPPLDQSFFEPCNPTRDRS